MNAHLLFLAYRSRIEGLPLTVSVWGRQWEACGLLTVLEMCAVRGAERCCVLSVHTCIDVLSLQMMMWECWNGADSEGAWWSRKHPGDDECAWPDRRLSQSCFIVSYQGRSGIKHPVKNTWHTWINGSAFYFRGWWWQCGDVVWNTFVRKKKKRTALKPRCYSRLLHCACLGKGDVWLQMPYLGKMLDRFEWLGRGRMASCDLERRLRPASAA